MKKIRLDNLLVNKGLFSSREKAKSSIMAGIVYVNGQKVDKAGAQVPENVKIEVHGSPLPYVSRGGLKLEKAINAFKLSLQGKIMMDVGASTGGFTDCALKEGAAKVYAVDVGYGQLAWSLRQDPRVVNLERTNIRYLEKDKVSESIDIVTIDVAFISLEKVLPKVYEHLKDGGELVALIKPQFEAGREKVGKKGVVKDPEVHREVIERVIKRAEEIGFCLLDLTFSPIKGPEGNIEYLGYFKKACENEDEAAPIIDVGKIVSLSHQHF